MKRILFLAISFSLAHAHTLDYALQLKHEKKNTQAIAAFDELVASNPRDAHILFEYGTFLADLDTYEYYEQAATLMKQSVDLEFNVQRLFFYGTFCCKIGCFEESLEAYQRIIEKSPRQLPVLYNSGYSLKCAEELDLAIRIYEKILQLNPEYDQAHLGLAFSYITKGAFKKGWQEHEWNLKKQGKYAPELRELLATNNIKGKTILLRPEGGVGDTFNFLRYVQRLKEMGARTIVALNPSLIPLISACPYIDTIVPLNSSIPHHDASATLMSLPALFYDNETTIPQNIPYIFASPERVSYWKSKLKSSNLKIGICWQPDVHNDISRLPIARRGIPLSQFYPLGSEEGITLYSLQKIEGLEQLKQVPSHVTIEVFDPTFDSAHGSFMDTAAAMQSLDLIISTDTATAHLAGALGRPVWLLLPYNTDWRWIHHRKDTPWYPTMRIYKQPKPWDWDSVMHQVYLDIKKEFLTI